MAIGAACATAVAVGGLGGLWASSLATPEPRGPAAATRTVSAGNTRLEVPSTWRTVRTGEDSVVLAPVPELRDRVVISVEPADHPSLIAASVRTRTDGPVPAARPVTLAGHPAWRYGGLVGRGREEAVDVTVLPARDGVLNVACVAPVRTAAVPDCAASVGSVSLPGRSAFVPAADLALQLALPSRLDALDRARRDGRAALNRARDRATQRELARRLAAAHSSAASDLQPVAGAAGEPLLEQLSATARAYSNLADAVGTTSASRLRSARLGVRANDATLVRTVDALVRSPQIATTAPVRGPRVSTAASGGVGAGWLLLAIAVCALGVFLIAAGGLRRPRPVRITPVIEHEPPEETPPLQRWDAPPEEPSRTWSATR